eukprot:scaffold24806_cov129-Isochrysis_galbana.AAC.1
MARSFWLIYKAICRLSGLMLKEAEKLVVDVGVPAPAHVPAGQLTARPATPPAAAADGTLVLQGGEEPGEPAARAAEAGSSSGLEDCPRRATSPMPARS